MLRIQGLGRVFRVLPAGVHNLSSELYCANVKFAPKISFESENIPVQYHRRLHIGQTLAKYSRKSTKDDEESDDEEKADPIFKDERDSKVLKTSVNSLRADLLLKAGLGLARNKVETIFYESKIRVNGKKLNKKSEQLHIGDEIDVIRGFSQKNPAHLVVARVIVLAADEREEGYGVSLRRYKSLLIENYTGANAFKSSETVQH